jgi:hypothetical protein
MKSWFIQLAGALLVLAFALTVGGFVMVLRAQQGGLAATMAAANIRAVSPPDGAVNVPINGEIRADYISRPSQDPTITFEPPVGVTLDNAHWDGTTFVLHYTGLRENSLYHVELDQDDWTGKGEHKQIKVRWSFRTGAQPTTTPTPVTSATPKPTQAVSPTSTPSSPPSATPNLIWYSGGQNGVSASGQNGIDWNGQLVKNPRWVGTTQAPDGRQIYDAITPSTWIYDADGNRVGSVAGSGVWADDSSQFCGIARQTTSAPYSLVTMPLDGSMHTVGAISVTPGTTKSPQVVACSALSGRAGVVGESNGYVWSLSLVSLTDGSVIYKRSYPNPLTRLVASHDGRYVAEQLAGNASGTSTTLIRELPSGNVVSQLTGISVQGFSWDGSLVAGGVQGNSGLTGAEVIRWQDRQILWNRCGCPSPYTVRVIAEPGGHELAIGAQDQHGVGSLTIVDSNGAVIAVPVGNGSFLPLF